MSEDEQITLLREIRDILQKQTDLVDKQWIEHRKLSGVGTVSVFFLAGALFVLLAYLVLRH